MMMNQEIKKRIEDINNGIVPEGYKQTPFGIFPCDWETDKKLKDLGTFDKGRGLPGDKMADEGVPCIGYGDIYMKYNYHFEKAQNFIDEETANESQPIEKGTLLFTGTGETAEEIGKCVCYNGDETIYAGGDIILFNSKDVSPLFLAYQQYQDFSLKKKATYGQGHSVVHIQRGELGKLNTAFPKDKTEQSKIAEILMKWDEMVELQEQYIQKLELRKKAIIQKILMNNKGWIKTPLTKVLKERKTYAILDSEYPHVTLGKSGVVDKTEQYERDFLVKSDDKEYKITYPGDIVYNPANLKFGVICVNKYSMPAIFSPIYVTFEVNDEYNVDFIGAVLCSENFVRYIRKYEEGSLYERQAVKPEDFLKGEILIPEKKEQDDIAKVIQLADEEISLQKEKLEKIKIQRKAMQQYLLTGIVRVS